MSEQTVDTAATLPVASNPAVSPSGAVEPSASATDPADTAVPGEPPAPQEPKRDRSVEKRISRLTQQRESAIREAGYWRGIAEGRASAPAQDPDPADGTPQPQRATPTPQEVATARAEAEKSRLAISRIEEAGKDIEDFDEVMETMSLPPSEGGPVISEVMRDYFLDADQPAHLMKWLIDNPKEAQRIASLSPAVAVRALERAEAKIAPAPAGKKGTQAPAPLTKVGGSSRAVFNPATAEMDDYAKWRRSGGA